MTKHEIYISRFLRFLIAGSVLGLVSNWLNIAPWQAMAVAVTFALMPVAR